MSFDELTDKPVWVARPAHFDQMVKDLASRAIVAVDTESNSLYAYQEQVCLIQISTGVTDYLVDPLALRDLSALGPIFADARIEKVFHAAEYDLICLKRDFGFEFNNLFDTMLAGRILGRQAVGLGSMLESELGGHIDKRFQRANWGQRPLPAPLLAYARLDSHYLIELRNRLLPELKQADRWELAQEDFRRMCAVNAPPLNNGSDSCWRIPGVQDLSPTQAAVLKEICAYRSQQARAANLPVFKVFSNQLALEVSAACPQTMEELKRVESLSSRLIDRHGRGLLAAVEAGLKAGPLQRPGRVRPDDRFLARLDALRNWRRQLGQQMGVESDVILPREILETIAQNDPRRLEELAPLMAMTPWRLAQYGAQIMRVLNH